MKSAAFLFYGSMLFFDVSGFWLLGWRYGLGLGAGILTTTAWVWMTARVRP